jgi:predicted permease
VSNVDTMALRRLWMKVRTIAGAKRAERDMTDELDFHVERETRRLITNGASPEAARAQARARFGSPTLVADEVRDAWGTRLVSDLAADSRYAWRQFAKHPWSTAAMAGVLALGLGFSTFVFVGISSISISPPAGVSRDRLAVRVRGIDRGYGPGRTIGREFSLAEVEAFAAERALFAQLAGWTSADATLGIPTAGGSDTIRSGAVTFVTDDYWSVLGVTTPLGRTLPGTNVDAAPPMVGVISDALWRQSYGASTSTLGQRITVNGVPLTIIGVAPRRFVGARPGGSAIRVWVSLNTRPTIQPSAQPLLSNASVFGVVARLRDRHDMARATSAVQTLSANARSADVESPVRGTFTADVVPLLAGNYFPPAGGDGVDLGVVGLAFPLLILLVTTTSVAALIAGRSLARREEIAIRVAIGAGRRRVVRQLVTETVWLGAGAALLAVAVLAVLVPSAEASFLEVPLTVGWQAATFAGGLALATSVAFGLSPALHATRHALADVMRAGDRGRSRTRLQALLVVSQIALTQPVLLYVGMAFLELRQGLGDLPQTTAADRLVDVRFNINPRYGNLDDRREAAIARVRGRLEALPGIVGVAALGPEDATRLTVDGGRTYDDPNRQSDDERVTIRAVLPGTFDVMESTFVEGGLVAAGADGAAPAILNTALVEALWGNERAVGRTLTADGAHDYRLTGAFTIVGVIRENDEPRMYVTVNTIPRPTTALFVKTARPAESEMGAIRRAALEAAPELPVVSARTLAAIEAESRRSTVRALTAVGSVGLLALALAAVGLYAVGAVAVEQRRREIGIRGALGADSTRLVRLFIARGFMLCTVGLAIGLAFAVVMVRVVSATTGSATPAGLVAVAMAVAGFVLVVGFMAAWIPARRAASVDPLTVIRAE